jgi:conjugative transfer signal peptidase TraF
MYKILLTIVILSVVMIDILFLHTLHNITASEKIGYYFKYDSKIKKGDLRIICLKNKEYMNKMVRLGLPSKGSCPDGSFSILKEIVGVPGDHIKITSNGIYVNNYLLANSKAVSFVQGIKLSPQAINTSITLTKDSYWVYGNGIHSFDSRYFGSITASEIFEKVRYSKTLTQLKRLF